jgi:hypothetical protein
MNGLPRFWKAQLEARQVETFKRSEMQGLEQKSKLHEYISLQTDAWKLESFTRMTFLFKIHFSNTRSATSQRLSGTHM